MVRIKTAAGRWYLQRRFGARREAGIRVLMILSSADPEIKWGALSLANLLLDQGDAVTLFLNGPATDLLAGDGPQFPIAEQAEAFARHGGELYGHAPSMALRGAGGDGLFTKASLDFLSARLRDADKVLSY